MIWNGTLNHVFTCESIFLLSCSCPMTGNCDFMICCWNTGRRELEEQRMIIVFFCQDIPHHIVVSGCEYLCTYDGYAIKTISIILFKFPSTCIRFDQVINWWMKYIINRIHVLFPKLLFPWICSNYINYASIHNFA